MPYVVTAIRVETTHPKPSDITDLKIGDKSFSLQQVVRFVETPGYVLVSGSVNGPRLVTAESPSGKRYVRTLPNDSIADNLLSLPRY